MDKIHVLLVREWDQQMSNSGCCGRIEGDMTECQGERVFPERRIIMEQMGAVYRALYAAFPAEIEVEVVDPRNVFAYTSIMVREQKKQNIAWRKKAYQFVNGLNRSAIIVNGQLVFSGHIPPPESVVSFVERIRLTLA